MGSCATTLGVCFAMLTAGGAFKYFAQIEPGEKMQAQIAGLPFGATVQQARAQIERAPESHCLSAAECQQKLKHYNRYRPNPVAKIRGPVLVYRIAGIDHIHCLYFDARGRLVSIAEGSLPGP